MAHIKQHIKDCENILGHKYTKVHKWMDYYAHIFIIQMYGGYHRTFRHNKWGLLQIRNNWGDGAMEAGKIHLVRDTQDLFNVQTFDILDYKNHIGRSLMYFNDPTDMEPLFPPTMIYERMLDDDIGMVAIAKSEEDFE